MELNKYFDHTVLKAEASEEDVRKLCREAAEEKFFSVCVNSCYVPLAVSQLTGTEVKVAAVAGFPSACKAFPPSAITSFFTNRISFVCFDLWETGKLYYIAHRALYLFINYILHPGSLSIDRKAKNSKSAGNS